MVRLANVQADIQTLWVPINAIHESGAPFSTKVAIRNLVR